MTTPVWSNAVLVSCNAAPFRHILDEYVVEHEKWLTAFTWVWVCEYDDNYNELALGLLMMRPVTKHSKPPPPSKLPYRVKKQQQSIM